MYNIISPEFVHGTNFSIGNFCVIEDGVVVGDNVKLGSHVILKKGTRFKDNIDLADCCVTTGPCFVGNNVAVRTGAIISKNVIIEDNVFYGPGVVTNHTKHVPHCRPGVKKEHLITVIGFGAIIGTQVSIVAGVKIAPLSIIGGSTVIVKDITDHGIYIGNPARKISDIPIEYLMDLPDNAGHMYDDIIDFRVVKN